MNLFFYGALSFFCLIALGQIVYAFKQPAIEAIIDDHLKTWYQQQQQELTEQFKHDEISEHLYQQNLLSLQRELLTTATTPFTQNAPLALPWVIIGGVIAISLSLAFYWQQGSAGQLRQVYQGEQQTLQAEQFLKALGGSTQVVQTLKHQLQQHPADPQAWYLLGRLYFNDDQFLAAADALTHANSLRPKHSDTELSLAEALYLSHQQKAAKHVLKSLLQREPENPGALNLTALMAYQQQHYQQAIDLWQRLWQQVPANSDTAKALQSAIDKAEQQRTHYAK